MSSPLISTPEALYSSLLDSAIGALSWSWDGRFHTGVAVFGPSEKEAVLAALQAAFERSWNSDNQMDATDPVLMILNHLGGMMAGQLLFTTALDDDTVVYAAWWPWGDRKTISLRLAPFDLTADGSRQEASLKVLKLKLGLN